MTLQPGDTVTLLTCFYNADAWAYVETTLNGQTVEAPAQTPVVDEAAPVPTYTVQEGDDLTDVSIRFGVSAAAVRELNNLGENDKLVAGQILKLPADAQQQ